MFLWDLTHIHATLGLGSGLYPNVVLKILDVSPGPMMVISIENEGIIPFSSSPFLDTHSSSQIPSFPTSSNLIKGFLLDF